MENRVGLFAGTVRGLSVLETMISEGVNVTDVLVMEQYAYEINDCTQKIVDLCKKRNINCLTTADVKPKDYENWIEEAELDVLFAINWRFLIPEECFELPTRGIFVLHNSLLPKYRGFAPTMWVLLNQEKETGMTLFYIAEDTDAGDIVDQIKVPIDENEDANTLNNKFIRLSSEIIMKNLGAILAGKNKRTPQNESKATYACHISEEDGHLDFEKSTDEVLGRIRAFAYPFPGAFCYYKNEKIIIWKAEALVNPPKYVGRIPGRIAAIDEEFVDVLTGDGILRITEVAVEDEKDRFLKPNKVFRSISQRLK